MGKQSTFFRRRAARPDPEWERIADQPRPARGRERDVAYWLAFQFLLALRGGTVAQGHAVWCGGELDRHSAQLDVEPALREVLDWVAEWAHVGKPAITADDLVRVRDALVREQGEHWESLGEQVQAILLEVAEAGVEGLSASTMGRRLSHLSGFTKRGPDRHGKALLNDLVQRHLLRRGGGGGHSRYRIDIAPAGAPW